MTEPNTPLTPAPLERPPLPSKKRRRVWPWLLLLACLLLSVLTWASSSRTGFVWLMQHLGSLSGQTLSVKQAQGTLWEGFSLQDIRLQLASADIEIENLQLQWQPKQLWQGELWLQRLTVGHVKVHTKPTPSTPTLAPKSLDLPLRIRLDQLSIASISLSKEQLQFYQLNVQYQYDGTQHHLNAKQLGLPWGQANATLNIQAATPFAVQGQLAGQGELDDIAVKAKLVLSGSLLKLGLKGELVGQDIVANIQGEALPFSDNLLNSFTRLDLRMAGINPQAILSSWPKANLSLAVFATPDDGQHIKGGATLHNTLPGALSEDKIPLSVMVAEFRADNTTLSLSNTWAQLAGGKVTLNGQVQSQKLQLKLALEQLDLQQLHSAAPADTINGQILLNGTPSEPKLETKLQGSILQAQASLALKQGDTRALLIQQLSLGAGQGKLALSGQLGLSDKQAFELNGELIHADPSRLRSALPSGDLNAKVSAKGQLNSPLSLDLVLNIGSSRLSGAPLSGGVNMQLRDQRLSAIKADLRLAQNRLQAQGSYGQAGDKLQVNIDAPNLSLIGPSFSGWIKGQAQLAGTFKAPLLSAKLQAQSLKLPGDITMRSLLFNGQIKADQQSPFQLQLDVDALKAGAFSASQLRARASGSRAQHSIQLNGQFQLANNPYSLQLAANGGLRPDNSLWQGRLAQLELTGKPALRLLAPVTLALGTELKVGPAQFSALGGSIQINDLSRNANGMLSTRGNARNLRLADLAPFFELPIKQDLTIETDWNLQLAANASGQIQLKRSAGDILLPKDKRSDIPLGLQAASATLRLDGRRITFDMQANTRFAQLQGTGSVPWQGSIDLKTPISANLQASIPSLATLASFTGPSLELGGQLSSQVQISGPLGKPQAQGTIRGEKLLLADRRTGVRLADGNLLAKLSGRMLYMEQLSFKGGEGSLNASGSLDFSHDTPDARLKVTLDKFGVFDRANRRLIVSGQSELAMLSKKLSLTGNIRADQGRITLPKAGTPSLGDDVFIKGRPEPEPSAFSSMPLTVDLSLDLGKRFRFSGQGLEVALNGAVRVTASPGTPPSAKGQVRVVRGRYRAYGQDLDITYGAITFNGPLDNPSLNVQAKRRLSTVGAGVEVTGTVAAPHVRLIADEPMSDKDRLAWLVLGRPASGDRDNSDMAAAVGMMLAGSLNDQVKLFDNLGISSREEKTLPNGTVSPAEQVVTIGRQLSRELYLGYEYGISSAEQAVKVMYQLSRGWSVVVRVGNNSSAESRYTLRFD